MTSYTTPPNVESFEELLNEENPDGQGSDVSSRLQESKTTWYIPFKHPKTVPRNLIRKKIQKRSLQNINELVLDRGQIRRIRESQPGGWVDLDKAVDNVKFIQTANANALADKNKYNSYLSNPLLKSVEPGKQ